MKSMTSNTYCLLYPNRLRNTLSNIIVNYLKNLLKCTKRHNLKYSKRGIYFSSPVNNPGIHANISNIRYPLKYKYTMHT